MKRICVYCGSCIGNSVVYQSAAREFGASLAKRGIGLVYGGGKVGLMGVTADATMKADGNVIGVIPLGLMEKELEHKGLTELRVVNSMHERKLMMTELSDAFVALPGGIGTADEIFEVFGWMLLEIHRKPCGLINIDGYYDGFVMQLNRMVEDGFLKSEHLSQFIIASSVDDYFKKLQTWKFMTVNKWQIEL